MLQHTKLILENQDHDQKNLQMQNHVHLQLIRDHNGYQQEQMIILGQIKLVLRYLIINIDQLLQRPTYQVSIQTKEIKQHLQMILQ